MKQTATNRRVLLIYPLFLFYICFAMIIIFWEEGCGCGGNDCCIVILFFDFC
jgi:hypothetical protein